MALAHENSVKHLANLYTVVAGLALSSASFNLIGSEGQLLPFTWPTLILTVAFIFTLIPFYHGAMRHLDVTYVEGTGKAVKNGALFADFIILFFEGFLFLILTVLLKNPPFFGLGFALLLLVDVVWGVLAYLAFTSESSNGAELRWVFINFVTLIALALLFEKFGVRPFGDGLAVSDYLHFASWLCGVAVVRTLVDYSATWKIYYSTG